MSIKQFKYGSILTQQNLYTGNHIKDILLEIKPERILEIGTARGGLTLLMSDILTKNEMNNSLIKSFDIKQKDHLKSVKRNNVEFYVGNIFNYSKEILLGEEPVVNFLSASGRNLIMCDGGNKVKEVKILSRYMNSGDIIMAHDYAPNKEVFESEYKDKIWNWMEINDESLQDSMRDFNLKYYNMELIKPSGWVALIKE